MPRILPEVDPNYKKILDYIRERLEEYDQTSKDGIPPDWFNFTEMVGDAKGDLDLFDFATFTKCFERDKANEVYLKGAKEKEALVTSVSVSKLQVDLLSAMERDTRMKFRSRIRTFGHQYRRANMYGSEDGPVNTHTMQYIEWLMGLTKEKEGEEGDIG